MKRLMTVFLVLLLVVSLMACSTTPGVTNGTDKEPSGSSDGELKGTIRFSTWGSLDEKKVNEDIIAAFEEDNPGCKVELEFIPEQYVAKIDTMFVGGNAPDVIYGHPHYFANWASKGLLMDLDERFKEDEDFFYNDEVFSTEVYDGFKWNGKHIATINGHDTYLLFYNKDMFDAAEVDYPTDDWTWNDLVEAGKKLTVLEGDNKQYGITLSNNPQDLFPYIYSHGGSIFDDMNNPTKVTFDNPDTVAGLQFMQDLMYKHKIAPTTQDNQALGGSFDTGRVAMDITGMWAVVSRKNITDFNWDVANLPIREGYPRKTGVLYAGYAISKNTKNPELAWEFAKYFQSDKGQELLSSLGLITVINKQIASSDAVLGGPGMPEHHALRVSSIDYAQQSYGFLTNLDEIHTKVMSPLFDQLLANTKDPVAVAKEMQEGLEKMLNEAKK